MSGTDPVDPSTVPSPLVLMESGQSVGHDMDLGGAPLLVISPHLDDAILSAFALLDRRVPVDVLTVFTGQPSPPQRTQWDSFTGFLDSDVAMSARSAENLAAFSDTPHRLHALGLLDDQYRGRPAAEHEAGAILAWVVDWMDRHGPGAVLAIPAIAGLPVVEPTSGDSWTSASVAAGLPRWAKRGLGKAASGASRLRRGSQPQDPSLLPPHGHVDHRFVRDTALRVLSGRRGVSVLLYEEVPYLWGRPADEEVAAVSTETGRTAKLFQLAVNREAKARHVASYQTQLPALFAPQGPLDTPAGLPEIERYWRLGPDLDG